MNQGRTIAFHTLGCKLNFAETSSIGRQLSDHGYRKVLLSDAPDVFLLNTCSVTENANRECRSIINKALSVNQDTIIIVTGCYAQLKPDEIASIPGVDLVLGASEKFNAASYVDQILSKGGSQIKSCEIKDHHEFSASWSSGRTRVFLKVQDGCDYNCSFCTIPLARGKSRSNTLGNVLSDARQIAETGAREIVLTGVNTGDFGITDPVSGTRTSSFYELINELDQVNGIERIRISSIEPNLLDNRIIEFVARSNKFVPHFHIPLQSGSDKILRLMRRRYLSGLYKERINTIKTLMPHCCIGVDVIVGFPGETDDDFIETYEFIKDLDISYLHVFTYSERENTPAATMDGRVEYAVRKERNHMLRILSDKKQRSFYENQAGSTHRVLFEADNKNGWMHGYTGNYIRVRTPYDPSLINQVMECRLVSVNSDCEMDVSINNYVMA